MYTLFWAGMLLAESWGSVTKREGKVDIGRQLCVVSATENDQNSALDSLI